MIKDKFNRSGKEQYRQLDTPKTEEKTTTVNTEGNKSEAPKKKKSATRHETTNAQNLHLNDLTTAILIFLNAHKTTYNG